MIRKIFISLTLICWPALMLSQHNPYIEAVDLYVPAPGQFVNVLPEYEPGDDAQSMAVKCTEAIGNNNDGLITLGAWGGYVIFHFDHPVINVQGEYDLYIKGNAITGSSEAGIVMVSQDTNGNGIPDDKWYELSGSADTDSTNVIYQYELSYYSDLELADVPWVDNQGYEGSVTRNAFHKQEYFPLWLSSPLSFSGTRLPNNAHDTSGTGSYWVLEPLSWGYVDNKPNNDTIANSFDISWAVDPETRMPVMLRSVDFIKVYSALNQSAGWLGETSTEIAGALDLHPNAEACISKVRNDNDIKYYDLFGRIKQGTYIIKLKQ